MRVLPPGREESCRRGGKSSAAGEESSAAGEERVLPPGRKELGLQSFGPNREGLIQRDKTTKHHLNAEIEDHVVFYTPLSSVPSWSTQDMRH